MKAPTGTSPVSECNRRIKNSCLTKKPCSVAGFGEEFGEEFIVFAYNGLATKDQSIIETLNYKAKSMAPLGG